MAARWKPLGDWMVYVFIAMSLADCGQASACSKLIVQGNHAHPLNGIYKHQLGLYSGRVFYKQDEGPYYLYLYNGDRWEFGYPPGGTEKYSAYNSAEASEEYPYNTSGNLYNNVGYGEVNFEIDCLVSTTEYIYQGGLCLEPVMEDNVVATLEVTQEECQGVCDALPDCKGYTYSTDGCFPNSEPCASPTGGYELGLSAIRGLASYDAFNRPTWQSSTYDQWNSESGLAVDGILEADMMKDFSCSHTMEEIQPWWVVQLPQPVTVNAVIILNRLDCCSERLQNFDIRVIDTDDTNLVLDSYTSKNFVGELCTRNAGALAAGERSPIKCPQKPVGNFVAIHMTSNSQPNHLTLCEIEVISEPLTKYRFSNMKVNSHVAMDTYCTDFFSGTLAQIEDEAELDVIMETLLPSRDRTFAWIGNKPGDGGYSKEGSWADEGPLQNIGSWAADATCTASTELDVNYLCESVLDATFVTEWRALDESVNAWIKVTLRYSYNVHIVGLSQLTEVTSLVKDVTMEFSDGSSQSVTLAKKTGDEGRQTFLVHGVQTTFLKLTIDSVYEANGNGFADIEIWGTESVGYEILDGLCIDGSDLGLTYTDLVDCQTQCKNLAGCTAFSYVLDGTYRQECTFFAGPCAEPDIAITSDATVTFRDTTDFGVTMRFVTCPGYDLGSSSATLGQVYSDLKSLAYLTAFNYCWEPDGPCFREAWMKYRSCVHTATAYDRIHFDLVTEKHRQPEGSGQLGCWRDTSIRDFQTLTYMYNDQRTVEWCKAYCRQQRYGYTGVEVGYECWCGDGYGEFGESLDCSHTCKNGEACGGEWTLNVFTSYGAISAPPSDCYILSNQVFVPQQEFILDQYVFVRGRCEGQEAYAVCERDHLFCLSELCLNGGTCTDIPNDYECACVFGYTGNVCETDIDDCAAVPCQNGGTCEDGLNFFTCTCLVGYTGDVCQTDINECGSGPCLNQGTCSEPALTLVACSCVAGFTGDWCETNIDECSSFPCQHGGTCTDSINSYTCSCRNGYSGSHCETEIDECASSPCVNGGTCEDQLAMYVCLCDAGYAGTHCETELDECASSPCLNGGACVDMVNMYECNCPSGFTGTHCETNINECGSDPCMNHVACHDLVNGYQCECLTGFTGVHCEIYGGIAGSWGDWQAWGECSVSCGIGNRIRERQCIPDTPGQDVANCGNYFFSQTDNCDMGTCQPVDGGWGDWEPISNCSSSCGPGIYFVRRYCVNPLPSYGGQPCQGESEDQRLCEIEPCPGHSRCDVWSTWSNCSGQCAAATHYRTRTCLPTHGQGQNVTEAYTRSCDLPDCDVQESMCDSCENTFNPASQSGLNCAGAPAACESGNAFCMTSYGANSEDELTLEKKCASEFECIGTLSSTEQQECNRLLSMSSILSLHVLGADEAADPAFDPSIFMDEDILLLWRLLNGTCSVCCQGTMCNGGVLPAIDSVFIMPSSASGLPAPMEMFLMCCLGVVPWMFT